MNRSTTTGWLVTALALIIVVGLVGAGFSSLPSWDTLIRRSTTANQLTLSMGAGFDGGMGKLPTVQVMDAVADADADDVHAAINIPTGATSTTVVTTSITDPPEYRNISITGSAAAATSNVVIYGTDWAGNAQTETITGTGAATVDGNKPFKTVNMIVVYGVATPGGATYTIGFGEKLGLYRPIGATGDVSQIMTKATADTAWTVTAAGALPTGASVNATYNTVDPETTITDADGYMITYNASAW